jgi:hypothetical protein
VNKAKIVIVKGGSLADNIKVEVLNIFKSTRWKPGTINGEHVQVQLVLPFSWE